MWYTSCVMSTFRCTKCGVPISIKGKKPLKPARLCLKCANRKKPAAKGNAKGATP